MPAGSGQFLQSLLNSEMNAEAGSGGSALMQSLVIDDAGDEDEERTERFELFPVDESPQRAALETINTSRVFTPGNRASTSLPE